jgi:hypothetical protein
MNLPTLVCSPCMSRARRSLWDCWSEAGKEPRCQNSSSNCHPQRPSRHQSRNRSMGSPERRSLRTNHIHPHLNLPNLVCSRCMSRGLELPWDLRLWDRVSAYSSQTKDFRWRVWLSRVRSRKRRRGQPRQDLQHLNRGRSAHLCWWRMAWPTTLGRQRRKRVESPSMSHHRIHSCCRRC